MSEYYTAPQSSASVTLKRRLVEGDTMIEHEVTLYGTIGTLMAFYNVDELMAKAFATLHDKRWEVPRVV